MKIGLLADVRGMLEPLRHALALLAQEGCARVACLGSTVEGGPHDDAVLAALRDAEAVIVPSPHDVGDPVTTLAPEVSLAGLRLAHATPADADDVLWLTGFAAPSVMIAGEALRASGAQQACGDLYAPLAYLAPAGGMARRRLFLGPGELTVPDGAFLACPGSVALAAESRYGGCVMTWDDAARTLVSLPFGADGRPLPPRRPSVIVYCDDFSPHRPDDALLADVDFNVLENADDVVADVERIRPDVILVDYHLTGRLSGLDAVLALRQNRERTTVPVLTIAGDPAENEGMKAAGAIGGLPFVFLRDTLARLIVEITGATP